MEHEVIRRLRAAMQGAGHDALVAFSQDNVTYTAGFLVPSHASNRFRRTITVLAGDAFAAQIVVNVEENLARQRSRFSDIRAYNQFTEDPADVLADALVQAGAGAGRIAIELDYMPAQDYIRLRERLPGAQLVPCRELYFNVRMIKTDDEIAVLKAVGTLTDRVAGEALRAVRPGMTEKALAQIIGNSMLEGGCEGLKCQVGSGARSGITNCAPTDKRIERGDVLRIEILGDMAQYRSNVTRTAVVGEPTGEQRGIWSVMIGARETCKAMLKPGIAVADLYRAYVGYLRARHRANAQVSRPRHRADHPRGALHHRHPHGDPAAQHHLHHGAALHDPRAHGVPRRGHVPHRAGRVRGDHRRHHPQR